VREIRGAIERIDKPSVTCLFLRVAAAFFRVMWDFSAAPMRDW